MEQQLILPCLRGLLGDWVFYSTLMTAEQIAVWIKPVKNIREHKSLDEILQRDLKERKVQISKYLLSDKSRFFNSIIVGVFGDVPEWYEFDLNKVSDTLSNIDSSEIKNSIGLMILDGREQMFAIDGQHRVAGIEIANKNDGKGILSADQFSVILVAHVDDKLGMKRTRKLFSDINKNARPVSGGDKIKIDEQDLCSIVTRRIYANYKYFHNGKIISLTESAKLDDNDFENFTNLMGLQNTNKVLRRIFKRKNLTNEWDEENVVAFYKIVEGFYNFVIPTIGEFKQYFIDKTLTLKKARTRNNYLLFRPIGIKILAGLYVHYYSIPDGLTFLKKNINKISFIFPNSPFNHIVWNNGKMESREAYQKLSLEIALYILGALSEAREKTLLEKYRDVLKDNNVTLPNKIKP